DTGSTLPLLCETFVRSYHSSCQTFLDLIDDRSPASPDTQRLRLRVGSRRLRPPAYKLQADRQYVTIEEKIQSLYRDRDIRRWPPEQDPFNPDRRLAELAQIMNPQAHHGNVTGVCDDRSLVYATGGRDMDGIQALVFISFDPSIRLE